LDDRGFIKPRGGLQGGKCAWIKNFRQAPVPPA
jgi:hypothetical protein